MNKPLVGVVLVVLMVAAFSTLAYAVISGAALQFLVWFVSDDIRTSVFLGTLITITLLLFLATRQGVRR